MRVADRHGRPLSEVLAYPSWELAYWSVWMSREPDDGARVERILAIFLSQWTGAHIKKGAKPPSPQDLMWPDYWSEQNEKERKKRDVRMMIEQFSAAGAPVKFSER